MARLRRSLGHLFYDFWHTQAAFSPHIFVKKHRYMEDVFEIKIIKSETEIAQCWEVALLLRPHLKKEKWFLMVTEMMENEKYFSFRRF